MGQKPTVVKDGVDFSKYKTIAAKEVEVDFDAAQGFETDNDNIDCPQSTRESIH